MLFRSDWEDYYSKIKGLQCKRTSYNTKANKHTAGGIPFRGHYAGIGYYYDYDLDAFVPPKPYDDCVLNTDTYSWDCPNI